jgi:hypothetical protein
MDCSLIEKLRSPKILDMSAFDWITSLMGAVLVGKWIQTKDWFTFILAWIAFGVVAHLIFGVDSMFGYYIGVNKKPVRDPKRKCPLIQ